MAPHTLRPSWGGFAALGTTVTFATTDPDALGDAEQILRLQLDELDRTASRFRQDSEISTVAASDGFPVVISALLAELVGAALDIADQTDGAVDPTVGNALRQLGYDRDFGDVAPRGPALTFRPRPAPGWKRIELNRDDRILRVPEGVTLDLGSSAKAFAADRAATHIADETGCGVLVNLGGDIAISGPAPIGGWPVGIALDSATAPEATDVVVAVRSGGLASSGTAVRCWRRGLRRVHHIVDPLTGDSADTCWQVVSVAASTCLAANAASTAAVVWGVDAVERLSELGVPCRLVHDDGSVWTLGGWPADDPARPLYQRLAV
jgi:thiamine biosynthesis lipoprotein